MTTFGPPSFNWDGGVNLYAQKNAVADFYRLTSVDAGPNPPGTGATVTSGQNSQTTGYQIAASSTWFSTVASGGAAVLPETSTPNLLTGLAGVTITILNTGANTLNVYVNPGDTSGGINGGTVTTPVAVLPGVFAILQCFQPGFWVAAGPTGGGGAVSSVFGRTGIVVANTNDYSFSQISGLLPNSQLANMPANTIKGNNTGAPAAPIDLTQAQATALLNQFTSGLQGLVSASGGGTTNFLRADNTWQQPPITINTTPVVGGTGAILYDTGGVVKEVVIGSNLTFSGGILSATGGGGGGGSPGGSNTQLQYNASGSFGGITNLTSNGTNPLLTAIAAPATPAAGFGVFYEDSTNLILSFKNAAGTVSNTVVASSAPSNQFATAISAAGVISYAQPSYANLSGTPGSTGQVIFNNAGTLAGMSGTTWDNTNLALTIAGATVTTSNPILNLSQTWNAGAVVFTALKLNVTNTASASGSLLLDLQVGSASKFSVDKTGVVNLPIGNASLGQGATSNYIQFTQSTPVWQTTQGLLEFVGNGQIQWGNQVNTFAGDTPDLTLGRDAANILYVRNSTSAMAARVYNTFTDANNYERAGLDWIKTANVFTFGPQAAGTGMLRYMQQTVAFAAPAPTTKTTNYSQSLTDEWLIFNGSGSITLTLLSAATYPGLELWVRTIAAQTVVSASSNVVPRAGGVAGTAILSATAGQWALLVSDGTNWQVMAGN